MLNLSLFLNYIFVYLWHCSWSYKFWRYMKFMHCNHTFALSYWICIWRNHSRIGAVITGTATHIEIKQCGCSPHFLPWDFWVEVKSCFALHHLHVNWNIDMKFSYISLPEIIRWLKWSHALYCTICMCIEVLIWSFHIYNYLKLFIVSVWYFFLSDY